MASLVSICMPHLNSGRFVHDRMRSILSQTLENWELIIVDSQSDDGSLAVLEDYAARDARIHIHQSPRDGIYSNINRAIERARGGYVYLATSDDTMQSDCLERMVSAIEVNPECGLAHCCLTIIDEDGLPVAAEDAWESYDTQRYFGAWLRKSHVRCAPHDGLLHFRYYTVFTSLTQLLVRREVYQRHGLFRTGIGSHADFAWGLRVGLLENVAHVPHALATWRRHRGQATQNHSLLQTRSEGEFGRLAAEALEWLDGVRPKLAAAIRGRGMLRHYHADEFEACLSLARTPASSARAAAGFAMRHPGYACRRLLRRLKQGGGSGDSIGDDIRFLMPEGGLAEAKDGSQKTASPAGAQST
ncbi:MAG: glycosyltransferase [Opitutaceae bacterium]